MRILIARLLVVVTGVLIVALAILFAVVRNTPDASRTAPAPQVAGIVPGATAVAVAPTGDQTASASLIARGRAVWAEQRCRACHSIEGQGNSRSVLDGVGSRLTEKEIRLWIVAPQQINPKVAKRPYKLSDDDLNALVAYLMAAKAR